MEAREISKQPLSYSLIIIAIFISISSLPTNTQQSNRGTPIMASSSDELRLFHSMLKKLMGALAETIQMYEDYVKIHALEQQEGHFKRTESPTEKMRAPSNPTGPLFSRLYQERQKKERLNKQMEVAKQQPKEFLSYKQRIAALRSINKHIEKENNHKKPTAPASSEKETKKTTAFFIYMQQKKESMAHEFPQLRPAEILRIISQSWRSMTEEQRKPFYRQNLQNRKEFNKQFQKYLTSIEQKNSLEQMNHQEEDVYQQDNK